MNRVISIADARRMTMGSKAFTDALDKVNNSIKSAATGGSTKTSIRIRSIHLSTYEAVVSLLTSDGYVCDIREIKKDYDGNNVLLSIDWGFR